MKSWTVLEFAQLIGTTTSTLRAWERRYHLFEPNRLASGYRKYDLTDLQVVLYVMHLKEQGTALKETAQLGRQCLQQNACALFFDISNLSKTVVQLLSEGNTAAANGLVEKLAKLSPTPVFLADACLQIMQAVGDAWHNRQITVDVEHELTARIKCMLMTRLFQDSEYPSDTSISQTLKLLAKTPDNRVICCALPGEFHEMGLLRLGVYLRCWGFQVTYLGANTPVFAIEECVGRNKALAVCISTTRAIPCQITVHQLKAFASFLGKNSISLFIGGTGVQDIDNLTKQEIGQLAPCLFTESLEELNHALCQLLQNKSAEKSAT